MQRLLLLCFLPILLALERPAIQITSDDDCWSSENNRTIEKKYAALVEFSPKIAYGKDSCSVYVSSPWLPSMQNGFGLFLARQQMDCASTLIVSCVPDAALPDQAMPAPVQFTCHTSKRTIQLACSSIQLTYKRNLNNPGAKKPTAIQVVALAKEPCDDKDIFFRCSEDYPNSCLDKNLQCNGRSECLSGDDELDCHSSPSAGVPIIVIILSVLLFLSIICILSTVLVCCCCRAAFKGIVRRFRSKKEKPTLQKGDVTISGEEAGLIRELNAPTTIVELPPQLPREPTPLVIDSTKPIYPRLE